MLTKPLAITTKAMKIAVTSMPTFSVMNNTIATAITAQRNHISTVMGNWMYGYCGWNCSCPPQQHKVGNCLLWRGTAADEDGPPWSHVAKAGCAVTTSTANVLSNRNKFHRPGIVRSILYIISLNQNSHFMHARTTLLIIGMSAAVAATAQCPFTPTILPSDLILCPNESGTLTTQVYDAYQWNKDGSPISGATGQTLTVDQWADAGSSFTVSATLDGCTEMSAPVLVDGWVFLLPYVMHGGDEPMGPVQMGNPCSVGIP